MTLLMPVMHDERETPKRPEPPEFYKICTMCWKREGTCWCLAFAKTMTVLLIAGLIFNAVGYVLIVKGIL